MSISFRNSLYFIWPLLALTFLVFSFGGVHRSNYLIFFLSLAPLSVIVLWQARDFQLSPGQRQCLLALILFVIYALLQKYFLLEESAASMAAVVTFFTQFFLEHPLLCSTPFLFYLFCLNLSTTRIDPERFILAFPAAVALLACICALSHWFVDNGKLFWIFAPEHLHQSLRARWPFVNPNHLAHFLIIPMLLLVSALVASILSFHHALVSFSQTHPRWKLSTFLSKSNTQHLLLKVLLLLASSIFVLFSIVATVSRAGIFSSLLSLVFFFLLCRQILRPTIQSTAQKFPAKSQRKKRRRRESGKGGIPKKAHRQTLSPHSLFVLLPILFFLAAFVFLASFSGRASEVFSARIEYSLIGTQSEMRYQLWSDSLPLLLSHPLFGNGFDSWLPLFQQSMSPELAGRDPEFLHSDPYQSLIELGLIGNLPLLFLSFLVLQGTLSFFRSERQLAERLGGDYNFRAPLMRLACFCGIIALALASFFDFSFRIPAITVQAVVILAFLMQDSAQPA